MDGDQLFASTRRGSAGAELIFNLDHVIIPWVCERIENCQAITEATSIGVVRGGKLIAGVVYHNYRLEAETLELSMAAASPRWAMPDTIAALLAYPFRQIGVWTVYTMTPEDNSRALRVNEKIGLREVARVPHGFGRDRTAIIRQMTRTEFEERHA